MNVYVWVLLAALAVAAAVDWRAVVTGARDIEVLAKPAFLVLLIALAWLLRADTVDYGRFLLAGLVLSLLGDVLLLGRSDRHFLAGLGAFLFAQSCYIAAFRRVPSDGPAWLPMASSTGSSRNTPTRRASQRRSAAGWPRRSTRSSTSCGEPIRSSGWRCDWPATAGSAPERSQPWRSGAGRRGET